MTDMTALRAHHRGGPEVLTVERAPVPVPLPGGLDRRARCAITFDELTWQKRGCATAPTHAHHPVARSVWCGRRHDNATEFAIGDKCSG